MYPTWKNGGIHGDGRRLTQPLALLRNACLAALVVGASQAWSTTVAAQSVSEPEYQEPLVDVHAFVSQGFIKSTGNEFLAKSKRGSFEFTEVGVNLTRSVGENLRVGVQLFTRDLGPIGNYRGALRLVRPRLPLLRLARGARGAHEATLRAVQRDQRYRCSSRAGAAPAVGIPHREPGHLARADRHRALRLRPARPRGGARLSAIRGHPRISTCRDTVSNRLAGLRSALPDRRARAVEYTAPGAIGRRHVAAAPIRRDVHALGTGRRGACPRGCSGV